MQVQPYLFFAGRCEEALEFYRKTLGAQIGMVMRFGESPDLAPPGMLPPGSEHKIMHAGFRVGDSELFASDGNCAGVSKIEGIALSLSVASDADARRIYDALRVGGREVMPMGETFFASSFGIVADRYGVEWMVITQKEMAPH